MQLHACLRAQLRASPVVQPPVGVDLVGFWPLLWVDHEDLLDELLGFEFDNLWNSVKSAGNFCEEVLLVDPSERLLPCKDDENDDSNGPNIGSKPAVLLPLADLWCHVARRAADHF